EGAIATAAMQQVINSQQDITAQELVTALWVTPAMAQIPLCESAKLKAIQAERSWGHVAEVKHKGCDQAPLRLKAAWTKELEIAENNRAMFATDALFCEAYRGGHMAYDLMKKALSASDDEEELLLWEETKLQIIKAEQLWSQAVEANRRDQAKAPDTLKTNWIATLETSEDGRERWGAYLLWCEALKVTGPAHDAEKIARNTLTDLSLWNKAKIKVGQVERAWTQAAWAGRRGRDQAPERLKASWIADLKAVENMEYRWSSKDSWYEAFKENITAFSAMTEAQNNFTAQNISLWNDVKLKAAQAKIAWAKAAEVKLKGRDQAPERLKAPWIEELEAAENYQTLNESFEFWCEANKLTCIADDASQKVNKTSVQSLDEVKSKAAQAEKAWSKAAEVKRKASNQTSGYFKDNFLKESKDAEFKEVLYAEKSFWCEANKVTIFADAAYNKAKAIPKAKAPLWNEVIIQGDQAERGWVQVIEANKKSLDKAPPQFKNFLEGLIKEAEENRTSWKNIITEATQKKADAEAYSSLFALSPFVSNTWYDEQIIAAEKAEAEASEKVPTASNQLEEAQKALKTLDDQIQEESSKGAKAKLANLKKQFQAHLQELQSMRETMEQTVKQCGNEIKARQRAVVWASEKVQKAKAAKEVALATIFTHFNQVNKDLVEGIETDQKEFDRNKRVLEATAKTDSERAEKERKNHPLTATLEAELAKKQDEEKIAAEKEKAREKEATGKEVLAGKNKGDEEIALQAQIEELKQFSLKNKVMKDASSNSSEQWELKQSIDRFDDAVEYLNNAIRAIVPGTSENAVFVLWKEAAARSKESAEQYIASAQVLIKGTKIEADRLDTLADLLFIQSRHAKYLAKATEAEANGKKELAEKWYEIEK
ncbi:MAG TPA: hypothetical protein VJK54_02380, partial [Chthoniobacterales bacterium]|nr:hypothetical protein [Chthoniobacterales bacterium]